MDMFIVFIIILILYALVQSKWTIPVLIVLIAISIIRSSLKK